MNEHYAEQQMKEHLILQGLLQNYYVIPPYSSLCRDNVLGTINQRGEERRIDSGE